MFPLFLMEEELILKKKYKPNKKDHAIVFKFGMKDELSSHCP